MHHHRDNYQRTDDGHSLDQSPVEYYTNRHDYRAYLKPNHNDRAYLKPNHNDSTTRIAGDT